MNFDSKHNLYYPKRLDTSYALDDHFEGDGANVSAHKVDVIGVVLNPTGMLIIGDVIKTPNVRSCELQSETQSCVDLRSSPIFFVASLLAAIQGSTRDYSAC